MNISDNISPCSSFVNIDLQKIEKRKSSFQFMIRQLELIEEQAYLLGQEMAGQSIFQAIQYLESVEDCSTHEVYVEICHE